MDKELAAIYGTGQPEIDESDLEKTAAAELLVKLAEEQGVDLNDFSDEEVAEMLGDLYEGGVEHTAAAQEAPATQEKYAEADYLGRIMAHSMVQELDSIEKEAASMGHYARKGMAAVKRVPGNLKRGKEVITGSKLKKLEEAGFSPTRGMSGMIDAERKAVQKLRTGAKSVGKGLAAGGALAAGGYTATDMAKKGSAVEALAEQRAYKLASEAGYIDKEASALDQAVEKRALEICEANGIPVEWNG